MATTQDIATIEPQTEYCLSLDLRDYAGVTNIAVQQSGGPPLELRSLYVDGQPVPWAPINGRPRPSLSFSTLADLDLDGNPDIEGDFLTVVVFNSSPAVSIQAQLTVTHEPRQRPPGNVRPRRFGEQRRPANPGNS